MRRDPVHLSMEHIPSRGTTRLTNRRHTVDHQPTTLGQSGDPSHPAMGDGHTLRIAFHPSFPVHTMVGTQSVGVFHGVTTPCVLQAWFMEPHAHGAAIGNLQSKGQWIDFLSHNDDARSRGLRGRKVFTKDAEDVP